MKRTNRSPLLVIAVAAALCVAAASCGDSSDEPSGAPPIDTSTDGGETDTTLDAPPDTTDGGSDADPTEAADVLAPVATFPIDDGELINSLAVSPDGATIAVSLQEALGEPVTIRLYDALTGEAGAETTFDAIGIRPLYWMADNRVVAVDEVDLLWHSFDGETLDEFPAQPFEYDCRSTEVDLIAGYAYSIVENESAVCRTDPDTGEMVRTAPGTVTDVESIWARPGTGEVLVAHYPDPDGPLELLALDGAEMAAGESTALAFGDQVRAVGATTWVDYFEPRESLLQPGSLPAPDIRDTLWESTAGTYFVSGNGNDDSIYIDAADGTVVGTTAAAWNPALFLGWSADDSVMLRLGLDYQIERYEF